MENPNRELRPRGAGPNWMLPAGAFTNSSSTTSAESPVRPYICCDSSNQPSDGTIGRVKSNGSASGGPPRRAVEKSRLQSQSSPPKFGGGVGMVKNVCQGSSSCLLRVSNDRLASSS